MTDPLLSTYGEIALLLHESMLRSKRDYGDGSWADIALPDITLLLNGMIVSGKVVSRKVFLKKLKDEMDTAPLPSKPFDEVAKTVAKFFTPPPIMNDQEIKNAEIERIYLTDVIVRNSSQQLNVAQLAVELSHVQGWTMGRMG